MDCPIDLQQISTEENSTCDSVVKVQPKATSVEVCKRTKPGLKCLETVEQLLISKHVNHKEMMRGTQEISKYLVSNALTGKKIFHAVEESSCGCQELCGHRRSLELRLYDAGSRYEGLAISRPFRCDRCCFPCFLQQIEVTSRGSKIGSVLQDWQPFSPLFTITDASGEKLAWIEGPFLLCALPKFEIWMKGRKVGVIERLSINLCQEDDYKLYFPLVLDVATKALLLAAVFLIDFMYFSKGRCCCLCCCL